MKGFNEVLNSPALAKMTPVAADPVRAPSQPLPAAATRARDRTATLIAQPFLTSLATIPAQDWRDLHARAVEPNAYYDPLWAAPVALHARGHGGAQAVLAWQKDRLIGVMPVRWSRHALSIPGPMLVGWSGYAPLTVPTLDRDHALAASRSLIESARKAGARALLLPAFAIDGPAFTTLTRALEEQGLSAEILHRYERAALDATGDAETTLRAALGGKKLKELRRQRHRLEDQGALAFSLATSPGEVRTALETFLALEASGWKGARGTALVQHEGDATFIRSAAPALAARRKLEIASLTRGSGTLASGLILRDGASAYFFKIAIDEREAKASPGVQLTLDLTRHLCADADIAFADSSTDLANPMIDPIWRRRIAIATLFIPLYRRDPVAAGLRLLAQTRHRAIECLKAARRITR